MSDSISSISPSVAASPLSTLSRPPETTPTASEAVAQEGDALRELEANAAAAASATPAQNQAGPTNVVPVSSNPELQYQQASSQISEAAAGGSPSPAELRAASAAYQAEASARDQMAQQQHQGGARTLDILA